MSNSLPAVCSAISAAFSAICSLLIWRVHRENQHEAVRPELILTGWSRRKEGEGDAAHEVIAFSAIRNIGRGPALNLWGNCHHEVANCPTAGMSTMRVPILASNEEQQVDGEILVWWRNVPSREHPEKYLPLEVSILCWDQRGMRHETRYKLMAWDRPHNEFPHEVAPGVALSSRTVTSSPVWLLRFYTVLGRLPVVGKAFRKRV